MFDYFKTCRKFFFLIEQFNAKFSLKHFQKFGRVRVDDMCVLLGQREWAAVRISGKMREDRFNVFKLTPALDPNEKSEWAVALDAGSYSLQNECYYCRY